MDLSDNVRSGLDEAAVDAGWRELDWSAHTHRVELDGGAAVSFVDVGAGDGPTVLLVHGLGGSWSVWLENVLAYASDHRVIAVDLPGFGDSPAPTGSCGYAAYAATLSALCDELGLTSVVAVGNSFGGWVCAELARSRPDLVHGLVLVDAVGVVPTRGERLKVVNVMRTAGRFAPVGMRYRQRILASPALRRRSFGFIVARADLLPPDLAVVLMPERPSPVFQRVISEAVTGWSQAWCDEVAALDVPALVVWGALDKQLPLRHAHLWHRMLVDSELVVVPGAGHMPMLESPRTVNDAVRRLLHRLDTEPPPARV